MLKCTVVLTFASLRVPETARLEANDIDLAEEFL